MAVKFEVSRSLPEGEDDSELMARFSKLIIEWIRKYLVQLQIVKYN